MPTAAGGSLSYYDFFVHEFWRFDYIRKEVGEYAQTFIEFPPMQKGASFNIEVVKQQIEAAQKSSVPSDPVGFGKATLRQRRLVAPSILRPAGRAINEIMISGPAGYLTNR